VTNKTKESNNRNRNQGTDTGNWMNSSRTQTEKTQQFERGIHNLEIENPGSESYLWIAKICLRETNTKKEKGNQFEELETKV
ncbi:unnamed protein product, partial [Dovyalis caffra]